MLSFITYSKLRSKLYQPYNYYTLSEFITKLFYKNSLKRDISLIESESIVYDVMKNLPLKHFSFVKEDSQTLKSITQFLIDVKRNDADIKDFYFSKEKEADLVSILKAYNGFLAKNDLADLGDIEREVFNIVRTKPLKIKADIFEKENLHFFTSKFQKKIFDALNKEFIQEKEYKVFATQYLVESFDRFDEVKNALKIIRDIAKSKEDLKKIKVIVSDIDEYYPIFETLFEEYGLSGFSTKGEKLKNIKNYKEPYIKNKIQAVKAQAKLIQKMLNRLNIKKEYKDIVDELLEERVTFKNDGVEITETNQIYVYEDIEHLIFVGADITKFPPARAKHIFFTKNYEKIMFLNPLYENAVDIYEQMKKRAKHLYIIYSKYDGKTKKSLSMIIDKNIQKYSPSFCSELDLIKQNRRVKKLQIEEFIKDLKEDNLDRYRGKIDKRFVVNTLSASRINEYIKCPRKYFYKYELKIEPPEEKILEMEATTQGSIMHRAFELIVNDLKSGIAFEDAKSKKESYAKKAFDEFVEDEDVYTKIYYQKLLKLLDNFFIYIQENWIDAKGFKNSEMELPFYLDKNLQLGDESDYFIKGVIDRVDINDEVRIFDYKSKSVDGVDKNRVEEIIDLKDVQLGIYTFWARQMYGKKVTASLISFNVKNEEENYIEFASLQECDKPQLKSKNSKPSYACYNEEYEKNLKEVIYKTKKDIENGNFTYDDSDEKVCEWCEYELICKRF